ncbi:hypothetical protein [Massilibacteroides sp.]|uniref:hypothetical protein n=1 Tax=Massilibacteroides sp. TaxID=2034766 RepID=UPI0026131FBD|nr:hypothetical protein [Massilibacteroides sp.]MDD4515392.1 hypothetical protein [Massilibacteroides sp.]
MGKTLLIDTSPIPDNPTTSHCRTIQEIAKALSLPLISTSEELKELNPSEFENFVVIGSAFYPKTAEIESFIRRSKKPHIFWLNNEHTCSPNSEYARLIKDYPSTVISNLVEEGNKVRGYNRFILLNLNSLLMQQPNPLTQKKYDILYYGTYRPGRRLYFQKYFADADEFILSSKTKNLRKFKQLAGCNCRFADSPQWIRGRESFNLVKYTIYLEDELMHKNFNHLSNRFYEALYCNVVQFFEETTRSTIERHGVYKIPDRYFVTDKKSLVSKINEFDFDACLVDQHQWASIAIEEKKNVLKELKRIFDERQDFV